MKIAIENNELVIEPGGWRPQCRVPVAGIDAWDIFYETLGRRFVALHDKAGLTNYISLPRLTPAERTHCLEQLTVLLGMPPSQELLELEYDNTHWQAFWSVIKKIGRYLRLFINPRAPL